MHIPTFYILPTDYVMNAFTHTHTPSKDKNGRIRHGIYKWLLTKGGDDRLELGFFDNTLFSRLYFGAM